MSKAKRGKLLKNLTWEDLAKASLGIKRDERSPNRPNIVTQKRSVRHANATQPKAGGWKSQKPRPVKHPGAPKKPLTLAQLLRKQKRARREEREG